MCLQAKTLPWLICLQFPGMSEEAIRSPLYPQQFFRMATSCTLLLPVRYGGAGIRNPHPLQNPLNGTVGPRKLNVARRRRDDSGDCPPGFVLPAEARGSGFDGKVQRARVAERGRRGRARWGRPVPLGKRWLSQRRGGHLGAVNSSCALEVHSPWTSLVPGPAERTRPGAGTEGTMPEGVEPWRAGTPLGMTTVRLRCPKRSATFQVLIGSQSAATPGSS